MKQIKIEVIAALSFILCWVLTYYALCENVQGALNVMEFVIGLSLFTALILHTKACQEVIKNTKRSYLMPCYVFADIVMVFVYVWYGHMIIGDCSLTRNGNS